ncbi:ATP synthase F0 subunit A [Candidatus Curtissbacteria bacterium RIFCSPHIGHO2_01_FULL_41_44]|nr:MAG: ATP synthase F0 subunit A [Candidatus Curtissbacteria bacterium RIFCSPHIGHO2_01_FULL_41_44]OGE02333.1 MAG: ATP synthase F0 subunit A [Candidatus Curtissbacteria bacterium RIFCSPLOWO2_12_FULL_41_16]OGE11618.1 MAG: ATP synthase F0 subunit A [Candidatus Curtissbacteria bacterium RIFCSPLOWO2_02_FULL_42_37]
MEISLAAEKIFSIGPIPITNTILTTWIVTIILIATAYVATKKVALVPTGLQNVAEAAIEAFQDLVFSVAGQKTRVFLPIVASFFFFILFGNYFGILPGIGSIGFFLHHNGKEVFVPLFRSINSDLNTTVALALVSLFTTHYLAIRYLGLGGYLGKFVSVNPIFFFVGLMEIVSEITKIFSLSFRLFGNIYAGEVLLTTASTRLFAFIIPIPFYFLELLVGFVQALIFAMLTLVFMVILTQKSEH